MPSGPFYTQEWFGACTPATVSIFDQSGGSAGPVNTWHRGHVLEPSRRGVTMVALCGDPLQRAEAREDPFEVFWPAAARRMGFRVGGIPSAKASGRGKGDRSQRGSDVACATWLRAIAKFVMSRRLFSCMHARNLQPGAVGGCLHACTKILSHRITEHERPINARFGLRACTQSLCIERPSG
jgi:hypothetical protein